MRRVEVDIPFFAKFVLQEIFEVAFGEMTLLTLQFTTCPGNSMVKSPFQLLEPRLDTETSPSPPKRLKS